MKIKLVLLYLLLANTVQSQTISDALQQNAGNWIGTLTYTDYQDDESQTTLPCSIEATWKGGGLNLAMGFEEPNGKMVYDKSKIKTLQDGATIKYDGESYGVDKFHTDKETGNWTIVMIRNGKDNNNPSLIKQTITYSDNTLSIVKQVKYKQASDFFVRNKYVLERKK